MVISRVVRVQVASQSALAIGPRCRGDRPSRSLEPAIARTLRAVTAGADGVRQHAYVHRSQGLLRAPEAS